MKSSSISVIIPAYNTENTIASILHDLEVQSYCPSEVIVVDDGSCDGTQDVLKELRQKIPFLKIICQSNKGAAFARNAGMSASIGEYLIFLDADDHIEPEYIKTLINSITEAKADIACCGANCYSEKSGTCSTYIGQRFPNMKGIINSHNSCNRLKTFGLVPWNKIFRSAFVKSNNLEFQNLRVNNDVYFVSSALLLAKTIAYDNKPLITYTMFSGNSIQDKRRLHPECALMAAAKVKKKCVDSLQESDTIKVREVNSLSLNSFFYSFYSISSDYERGQSFFESFKNNINDYIVHTDGMNYMFDWKEKLKYKALVRSNYKRFRWACGIRSDHRDTGGRKILYFLRLCYAAYF